VSLVPIDHVIDTVLLFIEEQRPIYDTIINKYMSGKKLTTFVGLRATIPESSLPSIEVAGVSEKLGWGFCRVQQGEPELEIHITTSNGQPEFAVRLEAELASFTTRILAHPMHLRPQVKNTNVKLMDSLPSGVSYGYGESGKIRVAKINWSGKYLEFLRNNLFNTGNKYGLKETAG
jgi:hypothetical protein